MHRASFIIVPAVFLTACISIRTSERSLIQAEARWTESGIADYSFKFLENAQMPNTECGDGNHPIEVEVRSGRTVKFGSCNVSSKYAQTFGSIPALFLAISEERRGRPPRLKVDFNKSLGYPEVISIIYARWVTDHGVTYFVTDLRELE